MKVRYFSAGSILALCSMLVIADANKLSETADYLEELVIVGDQRAVLPGSAYTLGKEALEAFDYTDINRLVSQIPGLYVRDEDGFGLRPNIGIRGATADRSQKLTLMEDSILIKPAPYSAPTAYYFPNINRMEQVEVAKGPATIKYGPHTVGGAMNLVTPALPKERIARIALGAGSDGFKKLNVFYGDSHEDFAYWVEGFRYQSDGFKELDGGGDTGFERNDINAKLRWYLNTSKPQSVVVKIGYADETSNETYLGLTAADFNEDPNRRYRASQLDRFESDHSQVHIIHQLQFNDDIELKTALYYNRFNRSWNKLDGLVGESTTVDGTQFQTNVAVNDILNNPSVFARELSLLRGEINSNGSKAELIDVTNNDRSYGSYGVQFDLDYVFTTEQIEHHLETGLRLHHDYVDRLHSPKDYQMINGQLVLAAVQDRSPKAFNTVKTDAVAFYVTDTASYKDLKITLGLRSEFIDGDFDDKRIQNEDSSRSVTLVAPSLGMTYALSEGWLILAGIYEGFSPAGSQANDSVDSEESLNIEYGLRYVGNVLNADIIGFFSDYDNLIGRCRASDTGCVIGEEFNGGNVEVAGFELLVNYMPNYNDIDFPISFNYTYTESAFQNRFESGFSQWGLVQAGDELPYVPENVARLNIGMEMTDLIVNVGVSYNSETRDVPGQGSIPSDELIDSRTIIDISAKYQVNAQLAVKLSVDNLSDEQGIVSRRPFGPRPDKPRSIIGAVTYEF